MTEAMEDPLAVAEHLPEVATAAHTQQGIRQSLLDNVDEEELSESIVAPLARQRRGARVLPVDALQEMRNSELANWNANYIDNMANATHQKFLHKMPFLAKKNASFWVCGSGIGGVGANPGTAGLINPLSMFTGDALLEALVGADDTVAGAKRKASDEEDPAAVSGEDRRVRQRSDDSEQIARGRAPALEDNDMPLAFDDTVSKHNTLTLPQTATPSPTPH